MDLGMNYFVYLLSSRALAVEKECNGVIFSKRSEFRKDFLSLEDLNEQYRKSEKAESNEYYY